MQKIITIKATNLPDVWFQTLYKIIEVGRDFKIDQGSFSGQLRKEFDFITIHAKCPGVGELLPKLNPALNIPDPVEEEYLNDYLPYLMTGEEKEGESYTYGQRICRASTRMHNFVKDPNVFIKDSFTEEIMGIDMNTMDGWLNQMELMIWTYKNKGHRNNQMILQVGQPSDMLLLDPPCLRHIDTRIQDGKLNFYPYFRSWDLWGGLPANLAAIELMKQYMANEIGVENGEIIATSKGCHIYSYIFEMAEIVRGKTCKEFKQELSNK